MQLLVPGLVAIIAFLVGLLLLDREEGINPKQYSVILGNPEYDFPPMQAPVARGQVLRVFSYVLTRSKFGRLLRRHLILDNGVTKVRELAAQAPHVAPLYYPVRRLNKTQRATHDEAAGQALFSLDDLLGPAPLAARGPAAASVAAATRHSRVMAFHQSYASSATTPVKVLSATLAAAERLQPLYKPFSAWPPPSAALQKMHAEAEASTERYASGTPLSIWDGVPVSVKDMINVSGYVMTDGSAWNAAKTAPVANDDILVTRFRELGAIVLPPTAMTEGGVTPVGFSVKDQGPFNPYNNTHYSGGSSGGSAVAVALGLVPVAIGFDGGGSIRTPAAMSGVVGFALGCGRAPQTAHYQATNTKTGPLAATIQDAALAFATIARKDDRAPFYDRLYDGGFAGQPQAHLAKFSQAASTDSSSLAGVTLGVFQPWFDDASPAVVEQCQRAVESLVARGAVVRPISIPNLGWLRLAHAIKISSEFSLAFDARYGDADSHLLEPNTRITIGAGASSTALEVLAAEILRGWAFEHVHGIFDSGVDAIVTPTTSQTAPAIHPDAMAYGESNIPLQVGLLKYVFVANFLGLPSISVPVGVEEANAGMPIGFQFTGPQWGEDKLLYLASQLSDLTSTVPRPKDHVDVLASLTR